MKRRFGIKLSAVCFALLFLLSGCAYGQSGLDSLLKPPKLSGEQQEIYKALTSSLGGKPIRLRYPLRGEYISAFVLKNMDKDPTDEAIVFYEYTGSTEIRMNILDRGGDGHWHSQYDLAAPSGAGEVDRVAFITPEWGTFLAAGFNLSATKEKSLVIYQYEDGQLHQKTRLNCASYIVCDIDNNAVNEIVSITQTVAFGEGQKGVLAECRVIEKDGEARVIGTAEMDPEVTEYKSIQLGILSSGYPALYLDGVRSGDIYTTEILAYNGVEFRNCIYDSEPELNLIPRTVRNYKAYSADLAGNNIYEIPLRVTAPGYENNELQQQEMLTEWYSYDPETADLIRQRTSYAAYSLGFIFTLPPKWRGSITVELNTSDNELVFSEFSNEQVGDKLLSIKVFQRSEYETDGAPGGYELLADKGQIIYASKRYNMSSRLSPNQEDVASNFLLIAA